MTAGIKAIIYPVKDLAQAKQLYSQLLGVEPNMDQPYYVNYSVGGLDIGLDPNGHRQGMTGPLSYWQVDDIKATLASLVSAGGEVVQDAKDVGGGKMVASVKDADGNPIGLMQMP